MCFHISSCRRWSWCHLENRGYRRIAQGWRNLFLPHIADLDQCLLCWMQCPLSELVSSIFFLISFPQGPLSIYVLWFALNAVASIEALERIFRRYCWSSHLFLISLRFDLCHLINGTRIMLSCSSWLVISWSLSSCDESIGNTRANEIWEERLQRNILLSADSGQDFVKQRNFFPLDISKIDSNTNRESREKFIYAKVLTITIVYHLFSLVCRSNFPSISDVWSRSQWNALSSTTFHLSYILHNRHRHLHGEILSKWHVLLLMGQM